MARFLHVVDGTFELFRAHYSKRPDRFAPDGRPVKATVGIASSMLWLTQEPEEELTHIGVAFDNPIESFRNDLFDGYKTGEGIEPELHDQFELAEEAIFALGMVVWRMARWEADDALATAAIRFADEVDQVRILTPDKDLGQCLRGTKIVQVDRIRSRVIDEAAMRKRRGVAPESIPDYLALTGDTADGIPGIPGFGEKTAATLLARYVHLEHIPDAAADWDVRVRGAERLATTLAGLRKEAMLYKKLATLIVDVPLAEDFDDLAWPGVPRERFAAWCESLGVGDLASRPDRWA